MTQLTLLAPLLERFFLEAFDQSASSERTHRKILPRHISSAVGVRNSSVSKYSHRN